LSGATINIDHAGAQVATIANTGTSNNRAIYGTVNIFDDAQITAPSSAGDVTFTNLAFKAPNKTLTLSGAGKIFFSSTDLSTYSGTVFNARAPLSRSGNTSAFGTISGANSLTISGASTGSSTFAADNSAWTGNLLIKSSDVGVFANNGFGGGKVTLSGGTIYPTANVVTSTPFQITGSATIDNSGYSLTFGNTTFQAPDAGGTLLTDITVSNKALTFAAGKTMGIRLNGNADFLIANSFTLVSKSGAGTLTNSSTWEDATMWTKGGVTNTTITATLATGGHLGTITLNDGEGWILFDSNTLGYVTINGLIGGSPSMYNVYLDTITTPITTIMANLAAAHPNWTGFTTIDESSFSFNATPAATTLYFGWDNKWGQIGANIKGLSVNIALPVPTITAIIPTTGVVGNTVTITGTHFTGASDVKFNGTTAVYNVLSDTTITATVPTGATTGAIVVKAPGGTATSGTFTLATVANYAGKPGDVVTITGSGFTGSTAVHIGSVTIIPDNNHITATTIQITIPDGLVTGKQDVTVTLADATVVYVGTFYVVPNITWLGSWYDGADENGEYAGVELMLTDNNGDPVTDHNLVWSKGKVLDTDGNEVLPTDVNFTDYGEFLIDETYSEHGYYWVYFRYGALVGTIYPNVVDDSID